MTGADYDVVIAGGGLAGLCLSKQLKDADPALSVLVIDRASTPLPRAAHKVGESTVEVGAYYFSEVVGIRDYLESQHLEKLGLRYFYGGQPDFSQEPEFGVSHFLPAKSYQLDRGSLEDHLRELVVASGVVLRAGQQVDDIYLNDSGPLHRVTYRNGDGNGAGAQAVSCRWVVDATGRRRLLQRKLGLTKRYPQPHNAVWFRLAGRLDIDDAVTAGCHRWHQRVVEPRWHSTNHLMFEGGWIWLIPLFPGNTSVGIVTTELLHPISAFNRIDRAIEFIDQRLPGLGAAIQALPVLDFRVLRNYSHSAMQVFSADRWSCVGDAAVFADPYYSVGSNMIAYANGLTTKMITDDTAGRLTQEFVHHANRWFLSLAESLTNAIQVAYPFYHNPVIMALKTIWDFYIGWGFSDPQYYNQTFLNPAASTAISGLGVRSVATQASIMSLLSDWSRRYREVFEFEYIDYCADLPTLSRLFVDNLPTAEPRPLHEVLQCIHDGQKRIEELAHVIFYLAVEDALPSYVTQIRSAPWLNVTAVSLHPERWESDGLFRPLSQPRPESLKALEHELRSLFRRRSESS